MVKNRPVLKRCPKCRYSAAAASKLCGNQDCGYSFHDAKQMKTRNAEEEPRRTKRLRRDNPKYSGSEDVEAEKNENVEVQQETPKSDSQEAPPRRTSGRTKESKEVQMEKRRKKLQEMKDRREDLCGQLSEGKQALAALFLSEINRKFASVAWKV